MQFMIMLLKTERAIMPELFLAFVPNAASTNIFTAPSEVHDVQVLRCRRTAERVLVWRDEVLLTMVRYSLQTIMYSSLCFVS